MGYSIVNILGGLLIVTSTMVVVSKNIKHAISWYAVQSLVLVGLLATLGATTGAQELLMWAGSAFITKVVLVPYILNRAYKKMGEPSDASLKAGLFPMHTWLPDAHSQAPSPVSALLSGVLLKCAMLVIMRFYGFTIQAVGAEYPQLLLLIVGTLSILVAALSMFCQDDLKRRFAYSSVENVGVIALCLGIGGPLGIAAALLHCVFHGFTKTLAFCVSGNIQHAFGTRSLAKIQGVVEVAPATAALAVLALLGLGAFPPFGMFISEFLTFVAGVTAGPMWLVVVVALGLTVAISALTRIALKSVFGHAPQGMGKHEAPALMLIPEIILAVMILWFGIATPLHLVHGVETATGIVLEQSTEELHATPMYRAVFGTETAQSEVE